MITGRWLAATVFVVLPACDAGSYPGVPSPSAVDEHRPGLVHTLLTGSAIVELDGVSAASRHPADGTAYSARVVATHFDARRPRPLPPGTAVEFFASDGLTVEDLETRGVVLADLTDRGRAPGVAYLARAAIASDLLSVVPAAYGDELGRITSLMTRPQSLRELAELVAAGQANPASPPAALRTQ